MLLSCFSYPCFANVRIEAVVCQTICKAFLWFNIDLWFFEIMDKVNMKSTKYQVTKQSDSSWIHNINLIRNVYEYTLKGTLACNVNKFDQYIKNQKLSAKIQCPSACRQTHIQSHWSCWLQARANCLPLLLHSIPLTLSSSDGLYGLSKTYSIAVVNSVWNPEWNSGEEADWETKVNQTNDGLEL